MPPGTRWWNRASPNLNCRSEPMLTLTEFQAGVMKLIKRGQDAGLDAAEMADVLQAELDALEDEAGPSVKSDVLRRSNETGVQSGA